MTDENDSQQCQYICPRKQRRCKMLITNPISTHCMEHLLHDPDLDDSTKSSLRIPCPINPTHSISPYDLKRHLTKCNQRQIILGPFHRPNCNSGAEEENHEDYPNILQEISDVELKEFVVRLNDIHDRFVAQPVEIHSKELNFHLANVKLDELGQRARKHLEQIGSLIAQLVHFDLLHGHTCYVEMGAGRGQLSHELHACLKEHDDVHFALIERDHQRYRYDAHHRLEKHGPKFERYRLDIRDLFLSELPCLREIEPPLDVVVISKHLCGGATDLALRSSSDAQRISGRIRAIVIALCCHHRLMWNEYVGKEFFHRIHLTPKDFSLIRTLTSWCTSENRHRPPEDGKRSTIDGISLQNLSSTSINRSNYSKQRLFSIEEQEEIGLKCKRILDWGRIEYLKSNRFDAHLKVYASKSITLENIVLVATPQSNLV